MQCVVREVHPELSFMMWNGGRAISASKMSTEGKAARSSLVKSCFGQHAFRIIRDEHLRKIVSDDDINDAYSALWIAERIHDGMAVVIPGKRVTDSMGLRMEMGY